MTALHLRKSIGPATAGRGYLLIAVALACFGPLPQTQAVSPAPDGGYSGGNTAEGDNALFSLTSGLYNTAVGDQALYHLTTGNANTANGFEALHSSITGHANTANGFEALYSDTTGSDNTAYGFGALANNIVGDGNTADGYNALVSNTSGGGNTANGLNALYHNISGNGNTANGQEALASNTGDQNTANGFGALLFNTSGKQNTASGYFALNNNTTGNFNIALGNSAGKNLTTGHFNIDIGNQGVAGESNVIRIGREGTQGAAYIAGIFSEAVGANNLPVLIDSNGKLGTTVMSSRQFKREIKPMEEVSETILALKPVTFQYKSDKSNTPQFGLIAEEVAQVNPDLVGRNAKGEVNSVRYDAVNAMLLNEFLKEHHQVQEQEATIAQLKKDFRATVAQLTTRLDEQASQIQKVSAQLEASKSAPQVVNNP